MNWHLADTESTDGRVFEDFQNFRLQQMRREVEALEETAELMRRLLALVQGGAGRADRGCA